MKRLFKLLAVTGLVAVSLALAYMPGGAQAAPGSHSQEEVNESIKKGVAYIDTQQNLNGSYGTSFPFAETGMALVAYGVLANGKFESLPATYQEHVKKGIEYLLKEQSAEGVWADSGFFETYSTGIDVAGLEPFKTVNAGVPAAIAKAREFLIEKDFQGKARTGCSSEEPPGAGAEYCGGWNYDTGAGRSDESNTGFAMFGLHQSGGVPAPIAEEDIGFQHHIQSISTNAFASGQNDGGGGYQPDCAAHVCGSFSSNAKDTGTMLFSDGYDGLTQANEGVKAGIKLGEDVLNVYELEKEVGRQAVYHEGASEDGSCMIGSVGCDWQFDGDGGYHYSLFSLTKGLGEFIESHLLEASNWYAKVVDLLLTQQEPSGAWPDDGRDDGTTLFATALSVSSLGLVGVVEPTETSTSLSGGGQSGEQITVSEGTAVTDQATLTGKNAAEASGTVEYNVYSDTECKILAASAGTVTVSGGKVPPSNPETLSAGTYYWQATYSGDKTNKGSSSKCGAEIEKVEKAQAVCPTKPPKVNVRWHYSANRSSGSWSTTGEAKCGKTITLGPQAMEGDLKVSPKAIVKAGYDFTLPGNKNPWMVSFTEGKVVFQVQCVSGKAPSEPTFTITFPNQTYSVTNQNWYPSGDQSSPLVYQGEAPAPDLCGGGQLRLNKGGTFSAVVTVH